MLAYRKPMSFLPPIFVFLLSAAVAAHFLPVLFADGDGDGDGVVKLQLFHRHHPEVSERLHGHAKPETLADRLRDLHDQDYKRNLLISQTLFRHQHENDQSSNTRRIDLQVTHAPISLKMHSGFDYGNGQYFIHIQVGTPPQKFMLIADTGSDLTWMKCRYRRCVGNCSANHKIRFRPKVKFNRAFLANRSSSFKPIDCSSQMCKSYLAKLFALNQCPAPTSPCVYEYRYLDGTKAMGIFANETLTVGLTNGKYAKLRDALIGCTEFVLSKAFTGSDGILGLTNSAFSFAGQAAGYTAGGFSYCLVDHLSFKNATSHFFFGTPTELPISKASGKMTYTDLYYGGFYGNFYGIDVVGISVDGEMLKIPPRAWDIKSGCGTIIDSGTSLTMLTTPVYDAVMQAMNSSSSLTQFPRMKLRPFDFCFNNSNFNSSMAPKLSLHFKDGVVFEPPVKSYILKAGTDISCVGFTQVEFPSNNIIGNILQQSHLWQFDFYRSKLGFAPSTCT